MSKYFRLLEIIKGFQSLSGGPVSILDVADDLTENDLAVCEDVLSAICDTLVTHGHNLRAEKLARHLDSARHFS